MVDFPTSHELNRNGCAQINDHVHGGMLALYTLEGDLEYPKDQGMSSNCKATSDGKLVCELYLPNVNTLQRNI